MKKVNLLSAKNAIKSAFMGIGFLVMANFTAHAAVIQSVGSGSAVSHADAVANFESIAADNLHYVENGIAFSRIGLSTNPCGYAGCSSDFYSYSGNYMYGARNPGGYFQIEATPGKSFQGLELLTQTPYPLPQPVNFLYQTLLKGVVTGSGNGSVATFAVLGFFDPLGFDTLRFTETARVTPTFDTTDNAPSFDNVRVQYVSTGQAVPEPTTLALLGLGLLGFAVSRRNSAR